MFRYNRNPKGLTLIQLVVIIVLLLILSGLLMTKFSGLNRAVKISVLQAVSGNMRSVISIVKATAIAAGLSLNKKGASESDSLRRVGFLVTTNTGVFSVDLESLCPENIAGLGQQLKNADFLKSSDDLQVNFSRQFTWIGYSLPPGACYLEYDSFACTVTTEFSGC